MNATFRGPAATRALAVKAQQRQRISASARAGSRASGDRSVRAAGDRALRGAARGVRGGPPEPAFGDDAHGLLPALDGRPAGRAAPGADAQSDEAEVPVHGGARGDVRELPARLEVRADAARALGDRRRAGGARELLPGAAAGADRRVQLRQLRAHGGRAPPQPVHDDPDPRAARRPELLPVELASAAEPLRPAVHVDDVRAGAARRGRRRSGRSRRSSPRSASGRSSSCGSARGCWAATRSRRSCSSG